jgi:hypothetical protein
MTDAKVVTLKPVSKEKPKTLKEAVESLYEDMEESIKDKTVDNFLDDFKTGVIILESSEGIKIVPLREGDCIFLCGILRCC